jgi:hypothetical protein
MGRSCWWCLRSREATDRRIFPRRLEQKTLAPAATESRVGGNGIELPVSRHYLLLQTSGQDLVRADQQLLSAAESHLRMERNAFPKPISVAELPGMESRVMMRIVLIFSLFVMAFVSSSAALCQGIPGCFPPPVSSAQPCNGSRPEPPITRTVQVDLPIPCPAVLCGPPMVRPPYPCAQPCCAPPPCPTRPVQVRVDVVVRPEAPKPCVPQTFCCENPPVFEPIFCQAAGLVRSLIAAPLAMGERLMGHPVPSPLPVPTPMPCWRMPVPSCAPCLQPPPATRRMAPCPPPVRYAPPGPSAKVRPSSVPVSARACPPHVPVPR